MTHSNVHILYPSAIRWQSFIDREAVRIFGGLAGATRKKVSDKLLADNMLRGLPRQVAVADTAEAMAVLEARIVLFAQAAAIDLRYGGLS